MNSGHQESCTLNPTSFSTIHRSSITITNHDNIHSGKNPSCSINASLITDPSLSQRVFLEPKRLSPEKISIHPHSHSSSRIVISVDRSSIVHFDNQGLFTIQRAIQCLAPIFSLLSSRLQQATIRENIGRFVSLTNCSARTSTFPNASSSTIGVLHYSTAISLFPSILTANDVDRSTSGQIRPNHTTSSNDATIHDRLIREQLEKADEQNNHQSEREHSNPELHIDVDHGEVGMRLVKTIVKAI